MNSTNPAKLMVWCSHLLECGWLLICFADRLVYSLFHSPRVQAKESVGGKTSCPCHVEYFFLLDCALRQACKSPCWVMDSLCVCLSHHLRLSLIHFSSVTFSLLLSPLVTLWLSSPLSLSVSCLYALLSFSICTFLFFSFKVSLRQCRPPVTVGMSICLFLASSLFLLISGWLRVCFYFSPSVRFWLYHSVWLFLPLSTSLCLHDCIWA